MTSQHRRWSNELWITRSETERGQRSGFGRSSVTNCIHWGYRPVLVSFYTWAGRARFASLLSWVLLKRAENKGTPGL